jgi:hypothetical protein
VFDLLLRLAALALFNHDHLAAAVVAATGADVMRTLHLVTIAALDEVGCLEEDVAAAIALPVSADSLLWQRTHV